MPNPFNFYGATGYGTGIGAPDNSIDFFTGKYFPVDLSEGGTVGFLWEGMGVKLVEQTLAVSGQLIDDKRELVSSILSFQGAATPLVTDSGSMNMGISGLIQADRIDTVNWSLSFKSSGMQVSKDSGILILSLSSGIIISSIRESGYLTLIPVSGIVIQDTKDAPNLSLQFYGRFYPNVMPDDAVIDMQMYDIGYSDEVYPTFVTSGTGISIKLLMTEIFYSNA